MGGEVVTKVDEKAIDKKGEEMMTEAIDSLAQRATINATSKSHSPAGHYTEPSVKTKSPCSTCQKSPEMNSISTPSSSSTLCSSKKNKTTATL